MELLDLIPGFVLLGVFKPITLTIVIGLACVILLLICSGLISGSEMSYFTINIKKLPEDKRLSPMQISRLENLLNHPQKLLATILIANNLVNVSVVIIATYITINWFDFSSYYWLAFVFEFVVVTTLILLFGEMLPKIYANKYPQPIAVLMAGPMTFLMRLFHPLSIIMVNSTKLIERRLAQKKQKLSFDDLSSAIEITSDEKTHFQERKILRRIVKFGDIEASGIMKPRIDMYAISIETPFNDVISIIKEAGFSRFPVYHESIDTVKGILYIKDLLPYLDKPAHFEWHQMLRTVLFVPENKKITDLLTEFKEKKIHMAMVVDEYGGTSGLITLEDILEEIVGEINDEFDVAEDNVTYKKIDDHTYLFEGKTLLNDLIKIIHLQDTFFDNVKGEAESLAGLILEITGKIPEKGDVIHFKNIEFTISASDNRKISRVLLKINTSSHA